MSDIYDICNELAFRNVRRIGLRILDRMSLEHDGSELAQCAEMATNNLDAVSDLIHEWVRWENLTRVIDPTPIEDFIICEIRCLLDETE